jgi:adenine C2-methylase RlmN of 23S rRNA A2503 and tRNA A37
MEMCLMTLPGEDAKRAHHLWRLMYQDNKWSRTFADAPEPHKLSQAAQAKLGGLASLSGGLTLQSVHTARDGTHKLVFALGGVEGGPAGSVETVLIPMYNRWAREGGGAGSGAGMFSLVRCWCSAGVWQMVILLEAAGSGSSSCIADCESNSIVPAAVDDDVPPAAAASRDGTQPRYTACLSTQVGCAMNCQFCYTGRMGLLGNLSAAQVVEQVVEARRWLAAYQQQQQQQQEGQLLVAGATAGSLEQAVSSSSDGSSSGSGSRGGGADADLQAQMLVARQASSVGAGTSYNTTLPTPTSSSSSTSSSRRKGSKKWPAPAPRISNIVYMGMGEPLHNLNATLPSIDILASSQGLALSRNKIIVSTVGLVPQLRELRSSGKAKLAVSLHATTDEIRSWIVPTNRKYPLAELMGALAELYPLHDPGLKRDDFVVIEYVLLKGVNDSDEDAARLLELTKDVYCMVNLIVFNPHEGTKFQRSDDEQVGVSWWVRVILHNCLLAASLSHTPYEQYFRAGQRYACSCVVAPARGGWACLLRTHLCRTVMRLTGRCAAAFTLCVPCPASVPVVPGALACQGSGRSKHQATAVF